MDLREPLRTIAPTLDASVPRVLAGTTHAMTRQQITRLVADASEAGIRKVLRRLADQGIVSEQRIGTQYTYSANRDHIMWPPSRPPRRRPTASVRTSERSSRRGTSPAVRRTLRVRRDRVRGE